jgi:hypothetical protein
MPSKKGASRRHTTDRHVAHAAQSVEEAKKQRGSEDVLASLREAKTALALVQQHLATFATLTAQDRKHIPKPHAGSDRYVASLSELPGEFPALAGLSHVVPGITADTEIAQAADDVLARLARVTRQVADVALEHRGGAYTAAMDIYAAAEASARNDATLETALAPIERQLAVGKHAPAAAATPASSATTAK